MLKEFIINGFHLKFSINRVKLNCGIAIFNFHQTTDIFNKQYHSKGTWTQIEFFEKQILWLKKNYLIIRLEEAIIKANENMIEGKYACITFDDGDKSIIGAMNVLEKYNIPATFFINSGYLDNKLACWFHIYRYMKNTSKYRKYLDEEIERNIKYLRATNDVELYGKYTAKIEKLYDHIKDDFDMFIKFEQLKNINSEIFHIGLHGYEHQRFSMKNKRWQKENIQKDIDILSSLKAYKPIFAIPFGRPHDWNMDTIDVIRELNLDFVYADGGVNTSRCVGYKRIPADGRVLGKLV